MRPLRPRSAILDWWRTVRNRPGDSFRGDDRGIAGQLDFLLSMAVRILAFGLLLSVAISVVHGTGQPDHTNAVIADRGAARLADDLLTTRPGDAVMNRTCTRAFFALESSTCGFDPAWSDGTDPYLNAALGVDGETHLNASIRTHAGAIATVDGVALRAGDRRLGGSSTVSMWHRQIGLDRDDDGEVEWFTLTVRVWS